MVEDITLFVVRICFHFLSKAFAQRKDKERMIDGQLKSKNMSFIIKMHHFTFWYLFVNKWIAMSEYEVMKDILQDFNNLHMHKICVRSCAFQAQIRFSLHPVQAHCVLINTRI